MPEAPMYLIGGEIGKGVSSVVYLATLNPLPVMRKGLFNQRFSVESIQEALGGIDERYAVGNPLDQIAEVNAQFVAGSEEFRQVVYGRLRKFLPPSESVLESPLRAVKCLSDEYLSDEKIQGMERMLREVRKFHRLRHSNIVHFCDVLDDFGRVSDSKDFKGQQAISMEYVHAVNLEKRKIGIHPAMLIMKEVLQGVGYIHENDMVHRDLKLSNFLVELDDEGYPLKVKIGDTGLVKHSEDQQLTNHGQIMGTPHYLSPRNIEGEEPNQYSDVYSLGVCEYRLLTGRMPFEGKSPTAVCLSVLKDVPVEIRQLNPAVSRPLQQHVELMMSKKESGTFTAVEALDQLNLLIALNLLTESPRTPELRKADNDMVLDERVRLARENAVILYDQGDDMASCHVLKEALSELSPGDVQYGLVSKVMKHEQAARLSEVNELLVEIESLLGDDENFRAHKLTQRAQVLLSELPQPGDNEQTKTSGMRLRMETRVAEYDIALQRHKPAFAFYTAAKDLVKELEAQMGELEADVLESQINTIESHLKVADPADIGHDEHLRTCNRLEELRSILDRRRQSDAQTTD